jgi:hypothetical protein
MDYNTAEGKEIISRATWYPTYPESGGIAIPPTALHWKETNSCYSLDQALSVVTPTFYVKSFDFLPDEKKSKYASLVLVAPPRGQETPNQLAFIRWMNEDVLGPARSERARPIRIDPIEVAMSGCWMKGSFGSCWELKLKWKVSDLPSGIPVIDTEGRATRLKLNVGVQATLHIGNVWNDPKAIAQVAFVTPSVVLVNDPTPRVFEQPRFDAKMFGGPLFA